MPSLKTSLISFVSAVAMIGLPAFAQTVPTAPAPIQNELGRAPAITGDVQRFSFPRSDLNVMLDGIKVQTALAQGGWLAFRPMGPHWEVMGDLVLTQDEIKPVQQKLVAGGLTFTAVHNHLLRAEPLAFYMHVHGMGDPVAMARTLKEALSLTKTPMTPPGPPPSTTTLDRAALERIMGRKGSIAGGGVVQFSIPRAQPVMEEGKPIPNPMGVTTGINFQPAGDGKVATTGDFILVANEVEPVVASLVKSGVEVTALHSHMVGEQPHMFFMHFWAVGPTDQVASAMRKAVDLTKSQPSK
ncbi:MAG TPA: DUF1259 domain-containing protein [Phenylobacterium sp.]|jgi:hypothetical protein|uniref:DUF1259 domain-containing protein n=1 Tax=Phenylobacterium sp. TaxID=1871053 RepID=UPI002D585BA5|nr:DUF1259 domain-containing protein [Phenylobacterium sp.]HZZ68916.1 DUF1259 domain-containing protein [Phenylobacterium sp.]